MSSASGGGGEEEGRIRAVHANYVMDYTSTIKHKIMNYLFTLSSEGLVCFVLCCSLLDDFSFQFSFLKLFLSIDVVLSLLRYQKSCTCRRMLVTVPYCISALVTTALDVSYGALTYTTAEFCTLAFSHCTSAFLSISPYWAIISLCRELSKDTLYQLFSRTLKCIYCAYFFFYSIVHIAWHHSFYIAQVELYCIWPL